MSEVDRDDNMKMEVDGGVAIEEENNEGVKDKIPFDPKDIKVSTQNFTLGQLIEMLEYGEIKLDTEFQRHPDLWNETKKSRFIESLLLRLPIPMFYFDVQEDNLWRIIDGLQRLSTLRHFVLNEENPLVLQNLEFLKEYEGNTYQDLPRPLQRRISTFPITIYLIEKGTPDIVKYNIFNRINQGGLVLTSQEMRHALHQGVPANLVADLVRDEDVLNDKGEVIGKATEEGKAFVSATSHAVPSLRMQDRDFATRFVSFYLLPYNEYEPGMDSFMNLGMAKIRTLNSEQVHKMKGDFRKAMYTAWAIFDRDAFRKRFRPEDQRKPINKSLFDSLSVNFAQLSEDKCQTLIKHKELFKEKLISLMRNTDGEFFKAITYGTAEKAKVKQRFEDIQTIIQETLQHAE